MIEDNVWDGFGENDHIVALSGDDHTDQFAIEGDGSKKRRLELHDTGSTDLITYDTQGQKEFYSPTITQEEMMLEEGSWSHQREGVFPSCDSEACKEVKRLTSDDTRMSGHHYKSSNIDSIDSELCMDDTVLGDKCVVEGDGVCGYPINHISQADNELSFLDNDGWLDIGNFEDVDRMFSCDSTFGMGSLNNEEEFCWLSSNGTDGSDDASKSTFKLSGAEPSLLKNISDYDTDSMAGTDGLPINDSNKKASSFNKKLRTRADVDHDVVPASLSVLSKSDMKSGSMDDSMPKEKRKLSKPSEGRRKNEYVENGNPVYPCAPLKQYGDVKKPFGASFGKVSSNVNLPHPGYNDSPSNTSLLPTLSGSRSEHNRHPSPSLIESSYASNVESSQAHSLEAAALIANEKRERLYHPNAAQPLTKSFKIENMAGSLPCQRPGSAQQQVHQFENENEGHSEVDGVSVGFSQETESSNVQEISSMSSVHEMSLEASFRQLQLVMDQNHIPSEFPAVSRTMPHNMVSEPTIGSARSPTTESDSTVTSDGGSRLKVAGLEGSAILIVPEKLTGDNYLDWSQSMLLALDGRDKLEMIQTEQPPTGDTSARRWKSDNALVASWLLNSMLPAVRRSFMFLTSAHAIWVAVKEAYGRRPNAALIFDLKARLWTVKQGPRPLNSYYLEKSTLWQELDLLQHRTWRNPEDAAEFHRTLGEERLFEFLAGLESMYDDVRSRLLGRIPLPSVSEAFATLRDEEARRRIMLPVHSSPPVESSALAARASDSRKERPMCDHCKKPGHTRDKCWDLHGRPADWKPKSRKPRSHIADATCGEEDIAPGASPITRNSGPSLANSGPNQKWLNSGGPNQKSHGPNQPSYTHTGPSHFSGSSPVMNADPLQVILERLAALETQAQKQHTASVVQRGNFFQALATIKGKNTDVCWIVDSGASDHMTDNVSLFTNYTPASSRLTVKIADASDSLVAGSGTIKVSPTLTLHNVLHVPKLKCNLLSVSQLSKRERCHANFFATHCVFQDLFTGTTIGVAKEFDGLYYLNDCHHPVSYSCNTVSSLNTSNIELWHKRLGHPNFQYMCKMFPSICSNKISEFHCDSCELAKHQRTSFPSSTYRPSRPFSIIHSDVWGPSRVPNRTHSRWFMTFIDDHTRVSWVFLLKDKTEVCQTFINFYHMIHTQFDTKIQTLHTDNGTEYFNHQLSTFLTQHGITHKSSCPHSPQQNGIAERKNRHILETARALLFSSGVPTYYWDDAILTATFLINRMPCKPLSFQTPLQVLHQSFQRPYLENTLPLRVFGCTTFVHIHHTHKLEPKAVRCIYLGPAGNQKGYKCFDPINKRLYITCDVTFHENIAFYNSSSVQGETWSEPLPLTPLTTPKNVEPSFSHNEPDLIYTLEKIQDHENNSSSGKDTNKWGQVYARRNTDTTGNTPQITDTSQESEPGADPDQESVGEDLDLPIAIRKQKRSCTRHPIERFVSYQALSSKYCAFISHLDQIRVPENIHEALNSPEWRKAVMEEMEALENNNTWEVVELPKGKKAVGCKWVFTPKYLADGSLDKYKARLVAKGFTQVYGMDYTETFAPVAKLNTIRIIFSLAANLDWPLHQLDVKNAFLNGELKEEVYMKMPPGFPGRTGNQVCRLRKSLYGLKQSPRAWFEKFTKALKAQKYSQGQSDHTLFFRHEDGKIVILAVYVDDIILTGDDPLEIKRIKEALNGEFQVKDLGSMKYFLGMEVARTETGINISQRKYILDLLEETGMLSCRPSDTPIRADKIKDDEDMGKAVDKRRYQRMVGKLIYLSHTRPDIAYAVSVVSQHSHDPKQQHLNEVYRILRYLKGSPGLGLLFKKSNARNVEILTDADWAGDQDDRRSTSGYATYVWGNLVTWRSKKQSVVARSSAEAEFRAIALGICEGLWVKRVLEELKMTIDLPIRLHSDNMAAINMSHNPVQHDRTKHVEIDRHFIREKIDSGIIDLRYIPSKEQTADVLTKGLARDKFEYLISKMDMINIYAPS